MISIFTFDPVLCSKEVGYLSDNDKAAAGWIFF